VIVGGSPPSFGVVQPSSLVFVAIVAVWGAYLVPSWRRRRSELAQWGSADRFSSRLRVLSPRRTARRSPHRSGDAVLTSPRVVVDSDGELLYIPAARPATPPSVTRPSLSAFDISVMHARIAAGRRARIMAVLLMVTVSSWGVASVPSVPFWVALPSTSLLVLHGLASRMAGVRSREHLAVLAAQARASAAPATSRPLPMAAPAPVVAPPAPSVPERVARRAAAVGAETWEPVPVPPPTYTLKPAVQRPEPAPLDLPAPAASGVSRGALPRTAADIERILALDSASGSGDDERKVVNG
jgi:hypothetical protein